MHENQNLQMEVSFENAVLYGWLEDNVTTQDFVSMFPINLEFEDYNHVEKISYLSEGLQIDENRRTYQLHPGDLCYYAPWENLCFFYREENASRDLVPITHFTSEVEQLGLIEDRTNLSMQMVS